MIWEDIRVNLKDRAKKAKGDIDDAYLDKKFYRDINGKVYQDIVPRSMEYPPASL